MSYVIGIAGGSAAGKGCFGEALGDALRLRRPDLSARTLSCDAYFRKNEPDAPRFVSPSSGETLFDFNRPDSIDSKRLIADMAAETADILLVEGLMVLAIEEIRARLDLKLFVDLDEDERALRRMLRDMKGGRTYSEPEQIARYYLESAKVGHRLYVEPSKAHADFIVWGSGDQTKRCELLAAMILTLWQDRAAAKT